MGLRGTAPKPTAIKIREGTYRKDRVAKGEMSPGRLANIPDVPEVIKDNSYAVDVWETATLELYNLGMLYIVDTHLLIAYCISMGEYFAQKEVVEVEGKTYTTPTGTRKRTPEYEIMMENLLMANRLAGQFGFTPSARTRIGMPEKKDKNPFEAI